MGVGGDDSWTPSVHDEFKLDRERYRYQVELKFNQMPSVLAVQLPAHYR